MILIDIFSADDDYTGRRSCMKKLEKELKNQLNIEDIKIHRFASDRYSNDMSPEQWMNTDDNELIYIHDCNGDVIEELPVVVLRVAIVAA